MSLFNASLPEPHAFAAMAQDAKVQALVDSLPLFFWKMDHEWRMTEVSETFLQVTGIPAQELVGVQIMDPSYGREESEGGLAHYFATLRRQEPFANFCYERILLDGTRCVLMDSAVPVFDELGAFSGYHGVTFQLTRAIEQAGETASLMYSLHSRADALEKQLSDRNKELEAANRLMTEVFEAMGEGLLVTSEAGADSRLSQIAFTNQAFLRQFNFAPEDAKPGKTIDHLIEILDARGEMKQTRETMHEVGQTLARGQTAMIRLSKQGRSLLCRSTNRPSGGRVLVHTDVTDLEDRSAALGIALEQAGAASAAKSNFLAAMSHEFRTPLNGIVGVTDLLADTRLDAEQQELVQTIQSSAAALTALISDILDFSKIEAGHDSLLREPVALGPLARDVVALLRPMAQAKGLTVRLEIGPEVPVAVQGDMLRLRQCLLNLLGNAVKFTDSGHVSLTISGSGPMSFVVEDTGIGIPSTDLDHIHEPFRQVQSGLHRRFEGTGLGLAITKRLIGLMGGEIQIDSTLGQGSVFRVILPLDACAPTIAQADKTGDSAHDLVGMRVLVAEDNRTNQLVLRKMLERAGAAVTIAESGTAAVSLANRQGFDLILMDVAMPGMNGFDASRTIRAHEIQVAARHCPIIAVTGNAFDKDRDMARAAGMDDFLSKPVRRDDLLACVAKHAGSRPVGTVPPDLAAR